MLKKGFTVLLYLFVSGMLFGQVSNTAFPPVVEVTQEKSRKWKFEGYLNNTAAFYNNGDLSNVNTSSYITVEDTDDKILAAYAEIGVSLQGKIWSTIDLNVDAYYFGFWGNDSLVYGSGESALFFRTLSFDVDLAGDVQNDLAGINLSIGRQYFAITEAEGFRNYVLSDTMDVIILELRNDSGMGVKGFFDFFSMNSPTDGVYSIKSGRHDNVVSHFDGDVNTFRTGILPYWEIDPEKGNLEKMVSTAYVLFSRIGANGYGEYDSGGYEISGLGYEGNFADNDWVMNAGLANTIKHRLFESKVEVAYSLGIDRKAEGVSNVNISGLFLSGEAALNFGFAGAEWARIKLGGLYVSGAVTDAYGHYQNYGFVGFKGDKVGGFLFKNYYGNRPMAVINYGGINFDPFGSSRRAPTMALNGGLEIKGWDFLHHTKDNDDGLNALLEAWVYWDTSHPSTDFDLSLPAHIFDQVRLGKIMGLELDAKASFTLIPGVWEVGVEGGVFLPLAQYDTDGGSTGFFLEPASTSDAPYGTSPAAGLQLVSELSF